MQNFSRRTMMAAPLGLVTAPSFFPLLGATSGAKPHFFLQILIRDGMDNLYLLDSRAKSFTAAGLVPNYAEGDAELWTDARGNSCMASAMAAAALKPFKNRLAVISGVHMPPGFDGHDQNINSLLTNNPFGGAYVAHQFPGAETPFERVDMGVFRGLSVSSNEQTLNIDPQTALALNAQVKTQSEQAELKPWQKRMQQRAERCGQSSSLFAQGCASYATALSKTAPLVKILADATPDYTEAPSNLEKSVTLALSYFKSGLTRTALVSSLDYVFDAHAVSDAQNSEPNFQAYLKDLSAVIRLLEKTPFDAAAGLSMLDVTTVMVSSEFGRTFGQLGKPMDQTGTDHNTLANMVMLLGKGIKGDRVIGSSDLDKLDANGRFEAVSKAHLEVDAKLLKKMGRPFDFERQVSAAALPETYVSHDYITSASVTNTLYAAFSVKPELWLRNAGQSASPARILSEILV